MAIDTAQKRAAAASVGIGAERPTYLATGISLDKSGRSQVAGSYRFEFSGGSAYIDEGQLSMGTIHNGSGLTLDTSMGVF